MTCGAVECRLLSCRWWRLQIEPPAAPQHESRPPAWGPASRFGGA